MIRFQTYQKIFKHGSVPLHLTWNAIVATFAGIDLN